MKCGLCGHEFDPNKAEAACKGCPMMKGCRLIRCPNCGFESPPEPKWLRRFLERKEKNKQAESATVIPVNAKEPNK